MFALLAALTPLIPLITSAVPALTQILGSPVAGNILLKGADAATKIFGSTDPAVISATIEKDKNALERFKAELTAVTEEERMWYADVQSARTMNVEAIRVGSKVQWVPVIITAMIFLLFLVSFWMVVEERISSSNVGGQQMV